MDWVDLQLVLCVSLGNWYCSPRTSFLCLLSIVKQGHHPHTLKASRLGIICLQSNLGIQKPKLGPLGACKILLGTVWCLSIRFLCSLATLKCSPESWLWPDCRRSLGFDLWHPFTPSGDVWPVISWKLSIVYQCLSISMVYYHQEHCTGIYLPLCGLWQRLCLVDIEFRCHSQDTSVWTDSARGTAGLDSKKISSSSNSSIFFALHPGQ